MPYANNQGVRIYYEVEGRGPPLVLHHGLVGSLGDWRDWGYVQALVENYQLVLVDARGHGASDKPHDPKAYGWTARVGDVVAVLDDLEISKAHYWGFSMGGLIGFAIATYAPERFYSLIVAAAGIETEPMPVEEGGFLKLFQQGREALLAAMKVAMGESWTPELEARMANNDIDALSALMLGEGWIDWRPALRTTALPCLIYAGSSDPHPAGSREFVESIPNARFVLLPDLNHFETIIRIDLMLPHIRKFLAEVGEG